MSIFKYLPGFALISLLLLLMGGFPAKITYGEEGDDKIAPKGKISEKDVDCERQLRSYVESKSKISKDPDKVLAMKRALGRLDAAAWHENIAGIIESTLKIKDWDELPRLFRSPQWKEALRGLQAKNTKELLDQLKVEGRDVEKVLKVASGGKLEDKLERLEKREWRSALSHFAYNNWSGVLDSLGSKTWDEVIEKIEHAENEPRDENSHLLRRDQSSAANLGNRVSILVRNHKKHRRDEVIELRGKANEEMISAVRAVLPHWNTDRKAWAERGKESDFSMCLESILARRSGNRPGARIPELESIQMNSKDHKRDDAKISDRKVKDLAEPGSNGDSETNTRVNRRPAWPAKPAN